MRARAIRVFGEEAVGVCAWCVVGGLEENLMLVYAGVCLVLVGDVSETGPLL